MISKRKMINKAVMYLLIILVLLFTLVPFFFMFVVSFKETPEAVQVPPTLLPKNRTREHYKAIFDAEVFPFLKYFANSFYVATISASISVLFGIFGGYALAKLRFPGSKLINNSFYCVYMFSGILLIMPLYKIITKLGLFNTRESLIIIMVVQTLPTSLYMLKGYFSTIPKELEEAALVDGLNRVRSIFRIVIPLSISGIVSVFVYAFMIAWNDYLYASVFLNSSELFTLSIGLSNLFKRPDYIWGRMMAAALITSLPVVIMYAFSDYLMKKGATEGGVKA